MARKHVHTNNEQCVQYLRNVKNVDEIADEDVYPYADIADDQCCICYFGDADNCPEVDTDDTTVEH